MQLYQVSTKISSIWISRNIKCLWNNTVHSTVFSVVGPIQTPETCPAFHVRQFHVRHFHARHFHARHFQRPRHDISHSSSPNCTTDCTEPTSQSSGVWKLDTGYWKDAEWAMHKLLDHKLQEGRGGVNRARLCHFMIADVVKPLTDLSCCHTARNQRRNWPRTGQPNPDWPGPLTDGDGTGVSQCRLPSSNVPAGDHRTI